ncbi:MAG: DUF4350 domain-containing protein [Myxococcales bacterium]|nr:DUF4350 domain-containing protein [Myxococcales bacterium]
MRALALLMVVLLAPPAWAQAPEQGDFEPESGEWSGLSTWVSAARGAGIDVRTPASYALSSLPSRGGLVLIGLPILPDATELLQFVREGGRLLVADDAGASSALLSAVGLRLTDAPTGQDPLVAGRAGFPVLNAPGTGVFQGVKTLVTNHPAAFAGAPQLDAAVRYASGEAFAYHLQDGSGELLLFADPSLFINAMQSAADNGLLSTNLIRWASDDARRTVVVLGGQVTVTGGYSGDGAAHRFSAAKKRLNEQLGQWGAERPSGVSLRFFSAVLLAILCLYAWAVFPGSSGSRRGPLGPGLPSTSVDQLAGRSDGPGAPRASDPPRKTPER